MKRVSIAGLICASIALTPVAATADDAFIGGLVGGIIGSAIANQPKRQTKTYRKTTSTSSKKTYSKPAVSSAQVQQNRDTQTALNYFGFDAGGADGVLGRRSRSAISSYQVLLNYPATGQLTQYERDFLMSSYYRAQAGGANTSQQIAMNPMGIKGLLIAYRDEATGGGTTSNAIAGHYGLPAIVASAVNEIARSSDPTAEQLVQRSGFVQLADINGDGRTDYILDTSVTGSAFWCNAQSCAVRVFASTPDGYERNDFQAFNVTPAMFTCQRGSCMKTDGGAGQLASTQPAPAAPAPQAPQTQLAGLTGPVASAQPVVPSGTATAPAAANMPGMPTFFGDAPAQASLQSYCNKVSLLTSTNGGFITSETMTDPDLALSEQLCLARTYAIARGEDVVAKLTNVTQTQIAEQCAGFGQLMKDHVSALSLKQRDDVLREVGTFVLNTGVAPAQLSKTAQICLGTGYKLDDMNAAMGSALVLVALGEAPYSELLGHHLAQGFGATERTDLALAWYAKAIDAADAGSVQVFSPGQPDRINLLRKAAMSLEGGSAMTATPAAAGTAGVLVFGD
ncbi:peptidoglycan-binding domain-containing protein [Salipiger sp.]|uniref:peptidoglycan-binding domain-containing protein n=1 Tax=Salipiger sp. TaxID=2078585 RepID=UPI003A979389